MGLLILMLSLAAMAMVAHSGEYDVGMVAGLEVDGHGLVADAVSMEEEMMMESETARRQLGPADYISYGALARDKVPCNQRGQSYYNCRDHQTANPYTRGCTRVTNCARSSR